MSITNAQFAQGLRELADIYDSDARMANPSILELGLCSVGAERFRDCVRALASGGRVDKMPPLGNDDYFYHVQRTLPSGLVVDLCTRRSAVCRKVTKSVMIETWECPDSLLDPDAEGVPA